VGEKTDSLYLREDREGVSVKVHLTPRSAVEEISGRHGDALAVKVKAPPVDGRANLALVELMSRLLGIRRSRLEIISGLTSREKVVRIRGLSSAELQARLGRKE